MLLSAGLILAIAALAGFAIYRLAKRNAALTLERARLEASVVGFAAALRTSPAALYLFRSGGGEGFFPGMLQGLGDAGQGFAALLERFVRTDAAKLDLAVARLRTDGTSFQASLRLAEGSGAMIDIAGERLTVAEGRIAGDAIWFTDASIREAAANERKRLRDILDVLPLPVWYRRESDQGLSEANRAYAAAVDVPAERAVAESRELAGAESGKALAAKALASGSATERRHVVINGSRRWIEITESRLGDSGELVGVARDLTDLEAVEAELKRHVGAHAAVLERFAVAVAIYGPDRHLTFFNSSFALLWQLEEDWLASKPLVEEVMERLRELRRLPEVADFKAFRRNLLAKFTSLLAPQEELQHLPDGRTLRVVTSPHPFGGLIFAYEDVTDRLALERSYNTLTAVQRETLDHLHEGIAVFGGDGRLKLSNPAYARIWKLQPEDIAAEPHVGEITDKLRAFFDDGEDWPTRKAHVIARMTADSPNSTPLYRRDGSVLQAVTVPLPDGNILLSYLDVTDTARVENALRERTEALETAGRLKSEFIANVSYELRTPLNAITGYAEMLTNGYAGELKAKQLEYSTHISESAEQLVLLINDILDLATIEAGYMEIQKVPVDVHALMSSVMTMTLPRARNQGLRIDFECPPDIGTVPGDEPRLKQVVFNLISNALKFTPAGGTVTLSARREPDRVALIVSDTGVGVAAEDQGRVFEKFERGSAQARQSGAGLGLSLVKNFIELHGGTVELKSQPGQGTTVTCWLYTDAKRGMIVMPGLDPGIHDFAAWIAGSSPAMTIMVG